MESDNGLRQRLAKSEALRDIVFGSTAGMIGKYVEFPFDTVKVRLQSKSAHYIGPVDCFRQSFQNEGVHWLYRGISAPLLGAAVETSCLFYSYRIAQRGLNLLLGRPEARDYPGSTTKPTPLPFPALVVCGGISGAFTSFALTPIELVKCQVQVGSLGGSTAARPRRVGSTIRRIFRQGGLPGLWRGQVSTLIRETGGSAAWFGSYEALTAHFKKRPQQREPMQAQRVDIKLAAWQQMIAGACAGVSYNFVFYPVDTIKSRIQTYQPEPNPGDRHIRMNLGFGAVAREIWITDGIRGFYRGCGLTLLRAAPSSALIFSIYEALQNSI